jgi:hypothetical protein
MIFWLTDVNLWWYLMTRDKPYYSKTQIHNFIGSGKLHVTESARNSARDLFGWSLEDIEKALLALSQKSCYKSEPRFNNPSIWVDYYRARHILGENVYTHFYVEDGMLIVDSFKEI